MEDFMDLISSFIGERNNLLREQLDRLKSCERQGTMRLFAKKSSLNRPKRPPSAYQIYVKENIADMRSRNDERQTSKLFSLLAQQWSDMDEKKRQVQY